MFTKAALVWTAFYFCKNPQKICSFEEKSMFFILCSLLFLLPTFSGIGKLIGILFFRDIKLLSFQMILGMICVTSFWLVLAFFFPLSLGLEIFSLVVGISSFFFFKIYLDFYTILKNNFKFFLPILFLTLFAGSYYPFILDHFGYYVPTIKWLTEYGLVKGISNLDILLGQMSLWHILQAGFSHFADPFLRLNVVVLIVYLFYVIEKKSWIHLVFFPVLFLFVQSPSPELPVIVFALILINEILKKNTNISFLFLVAVFTFAIKPTMLWMPLFAFMYGFFIIKANLKFIVLGTIILILFLAKNIWTFGYPVFPVQSFDLGVSWKPNADVLFESSKMAIRKTFDMQYSNTEINKFSNLDFIKNWLFLNGIKSWIHISFIFSLIVLFIYSFKKNQKILYFLCSAIFIKSILVLVFSAQYRFFLEVFFVVFFLLFNDLISKKTSLVLFTFGSFLFFTFFSFPNILVKIVPSFKLGTFMTGFQKNQWMKPSVFEWKKFQTYQIGKLKFNVVKNYPFSFDAPIPAISPEFLIQDFEAGIFPQLNTEDPKDGFYWRKLTSSEKAKLKEILLNQNYLPESQK